MPDHTSLQRALRILQQLNLRKSVTVNQLYEYFDRTEEKRAIQRTLDSIQAANIPLTTTRGAHNEKFYSLPRAFDFVPMQLTSDEMIAAMLLGQFRHLFDGTRIGTDIDRVMEKMRQILPSGDVVMPAAFTQTAGMLHVHEPGSQDMTGTDEVFRTMLHGIVERRVTHITYRRKSYDVHPYTVLLHMGAVYFIAYQPRHEQYIYLALPRIREAELTDANFERDPGFNVEHILGDAFGLWSKPAVRVVIRFSPEVRESILHRRWHAKQKIKENDDGSMDLQMEVSMSSELVAWILRWGRHAVVRHPFELRVLIRDEVAAMAEEYAYKEARPPRSDFTSLEG